MNAVHQPVLGDLDAYLLGEGTHLRLYDVMGAHVRTFNGVTGTAFALWAPNARRVSVVGDFNDWDGNRDRMWLRRECGVWELFVPGVAPGARYKYELEDNAGHLLPLRVDPIGFYAEQRPRNASIVVGCATVSCGATVPGWPAAAPNSTAMRRSRFTKCTSVRGRACRKRETAFSPIAS